jgi:hypothetical protein
MHKEVFISVITKAIEAYFYNSLGDTDNSSSRQNSSPTAK